MALDRHAVSLQRSGTGPILENLLESTGPADISLVGHNTIATMSTNNHLSAFRTRRRLIARWVLELLEIVRIGCHIHIVLSVEAFTARLAGLPETLMTLMRVIGTERVVIVIAPTAIAGIRKHDIRVAIIADPVVTTRRFGEFPGFPTQTTTRLGSRFLCRFCCHREPSPLVRLLLSPIVWLADVLLLGKASLVSFLIAHAFLMSRSIEREVFSSLLFYHIPSFSKKSSLFILRQNRLLSLICTSYVHPYPKVVKALVGHIDGLHLSLLDHWEEMQATILLARMSALTGQTLKMRGEQCCGAEMPPTGLRCQQ